MPTNQIQVIKEQTQVIKEQTQAIQGITTLQAIDVVLEMFGINIDTVCQDELESFQFNIEAKASVYTGTRFSCFSKVRNKEVNYNYNSISNVVCDLVAMNLVTWLSSDLSYVKDTSACKIEVCFNSCTSTLTGEVWTIEDTTMEDSSLYFSFNKESAEIYLKNHLSSVRDESNENYSHLIFEDNKISGVDCIGCKIIQGSEHY